MRLFTAFLVAMLLSSFSHAESISMGSATVNGKSITYRVSGESTSTSSSTNAEGFMLEANVDGIKHEIKITPNEIKWNGKKKTLNKYDKIEINISGDKMKILVDGKELSE